MREGNIRWGIGRFSQKLKILKFSKSETLRCMPCEVHAHEAHTCEMHVYEVHADEMHACKVYAYEILANKILSRPEAR